MADAPPPLPEPEAFARNLLAWFRRARRDLPWRRTRDPYAIWVSEVMLQQTTVATVHDRWGRFLARFPTIEALAAAPEAEVLAAWRGLGYYARARHLHAAARALVAAGAGTLPNDYAMLRALPGMGDYTAAAVASIAFGEPVAAFDANVRRVMARLLAYSGEADRPASVRVLRAAAEALLPRDRAGDFNEAMMELGATVCLPRGPRCGACPVAVHCRGGATGNAEAFPRLREKAPMVAVTEAAVAIWRGDRVLVLRRARPGSFAGMWELPRVEVGAGESIRAAAARAAREQAGLLVEAEESPWRRRHSVMRRRIELRVCLARDAGGVVALTAAHDRAEWLLPREWAALPTGSTQHAAALWLAGAAE